MKVAAFRDRLHTVLFEADTPAGRGFDAALFLLILTSTLTVMMESVQSISTGREELFRILEWSFTSLFLAEYLLRLCSVRRPLSYAKSFFGLVDLLAVLPSFIGIFIPGTPSLLAIRVIRLLRLFRVLKLSALFEQSVIILEALRSARNKIIVFLFTVSILTVVFGAIMYTLEGATNPGFDSIPRSVYWCIVTITTVGYGDIFPVTPVGQFISAALMLIGYSIIAIPTGIVTSEFIRNNRVRQEQKEISTQVCRYCSREGHDPDALYCKFCGEKLNNP